MQPMQLHYSYFWVLHASAASCGQLSVTGWLNWPTAYRSRAWLPLVVGPGRRFSMPPPCSVSKALLPKQSPSVCGVRSFAGSHLRVQNVLMCTVLWKPLGASGYNCLKSGMNGAAWKFRAKSVAV